MSGWVKFEKDLQTDPRVLRVAKHLVRQFQFSSVTVGSESCNALPLPAVTLVSGALLRMWCYADSHIRDDDTLDVSLAELDEIIGLPGFCALLPPEWLTVVDECCVELPGFQAKNGVEAKSRALSAKRVERHRKRYTVTSSNAPPLPDQTRPDQTRPDQKAVTAAAPPGKTRKPRVSRETEPDWWLDFKLAYPDRAGDPNWRGAIRAAHARCAEGHTPDEFLAGAKRYAAYVAATGKGGTEYVQQASRFLGPSRPFMGPWNIPRETSPPARLSAVDQVRQATGCDLRKLAGG